MAVPLSRSHQALLDCLHVWGIGRVSPLDVLFHGKHLLDDLLVPLIQCLGQVADPVVLLLGVEGAEVGPGKIDA